eukprot:8388847-Ditylum_brightwellii.AAC.1
MRNILQGYWRSTKAPYQQSQFPFKNTIEFELFTAMPLVGKDIKDIELRHNDSLYNWASSLQYIVQRSTIDVGYAVMGLSSYMASPKKLIFDVLHQCMDFLYHHPHRPIMYPRKNFHLSQPNLEVHFGSGKAEYFKQYKPFIAMYSDTYLARELRERRSTTSIALLTNS